MFSINSMDKNSIKEFRHDLLLNSSEEPLFEETDRTFFPAYVELPYPVHRPLKTTEKDVVKQLLEEKETYRKLLESKKKRYKYDKKEIVEQKIANHEYIYLPRHMLEFYQKKDPDPYFNCDYNYYYTGGNLEHLQINSTDYLVRCDSENNLLLNNLRKSRDTKIIDSYCESPIFSISSVSINGDSKLLLREKNYVNIARLIGTTEISKLFTHKYDIPVLDAKVNEKKPTHLGVVLSNGKIIVRDIETGWILLSFKNQVAETDNFQRFQFLDENNIILADRFVVKLLDYRAKSEEMVFQPHLINCNSLCNLGVLKNVLLLASRHYIIKTDLRYLKNFSYYSHTLSRGPCYMDFTTKDDDTFLCLANQNQDGKVLFTGKSPYTLPFKVPGIQETLKECRLRNSSLVFMDNLEARLNFSVAGLKVVNLDNEICIYSSNCLGEIFCQKVRDEEPVIEKPVERLLKFINKLEKPKPVLYLSHVEEMSRARFSLNTKTIDRNLAKFKAESKANEILEVYRSRYARKNISSILALDFLAVWDDSEEEDDEDLPEVPPNDKVNDWIQRNDFSDNENSFGFSLSHSI